MKKIYVLALCVLSITILEAKLRRKVQQPSYSAKPPTLKLRSPGASSYAEATAVPGEASGESWADKSADKSKDTAKPKVRRAISVTNNITPEMLVKKHWTGNYTPDPFAIVVDGKELAPGKTTQVTIEDDTLNVHYKYSFMNGYRKGTDEVTFNVPEKQEKIDLTFSWEDKYRVLVQHATAVKRREI